MLSQLPTSVGTDVDPATHFSTLKHYQFTVLSAKNEDPEKSKHQKHQQLFLHPKKKECKECISYPHFCRDRKNQKRTINT